MDPNANIYSNIAATTPDQDFKSSPKRSMNARVILPHAGSQVQQSQQTSHINGSYSSNNIGGGINPPFVPSQHHLHQQPQQQHQQHQQSFVPSNNASMYSALGSNMNSPMNMAGMTGNIGNQQMFPNVYTAGTSMYPSIQTTNSMAGVNGAGNNNNINAMNQMMFTAGMGNGINSMMNGGMSSGMNSGINAGLNSGINTATAAAAAAATGNSTAAPMGYPSSWQLQNAMLANGTGVPGVARMMYQGSGYPQTTSQQASISQYTVGNMGINNVGFDPNYMQGAGGGVNQQMAMNMMGAGMSRPGMGMGMTPYPNFKFQNLAEQKGMRPSPTKRKSGGSTKASPANSPKVKNMRLNSVDANIDPSPSPGPSPQSAMALTSSNNLSLSGLTNIAESDYGTPLHMASNVQSPIEANMGLTTSLGTPMNMNGSVQSSNAMPTNYNMHNMGPIMSQRYSQSQHQQMQQSPITSNYSLSAALAGGNISQPQSMQQSMQPSPQQQQQHYMHDRQRTPSVASSSIDDVIQQSSNITDSTSTRSPMSNTTPKQAPAMPYPSNLARTTPTPASLLQQQQQHNLYQMPQSQQSPSAISPAKQASMLQQVQSQLPSPSLIPNQLPQQQQQPYQRSNVRPASPTTLQAQTPQSSFRPPTPQELQLRPPTPQSQHAQTHSRSPSVPIMDGTVSPAASSSSAMPPSPATRLPEQKPSIDANFAKPAPGPLGSNAVVAGSSSTAIEKPSAQTRQLQPKTAVFAPKTRVVETYGGIDLKYFEKFEIKPLFPNVADLGVIDINALSMSIKSGMRLEITNALNNLTFLAASRTFFVYLSKCDDLLDVLLGLLEQTFDEMLSIDAESGSRESKTAQGTTYSELFDLSLDEMKSVIPQLENTSSELWFTPREKCLCISNLLRNFSFMEDTSNHTHPSYLPPSNPQFMAGHPYLLEVITKTLTVSSEICTRSEMKEGGLRRMDVLEYRKSVLIMLANLMIHITFRNKNTASPLVEFVRDFLVTGADTYYANVAIEVWAKMSVSYDNRAVLSTVSNFTDIEDIWSALISILRRDHIGPGGRIVSPVDLRTQLPMMELIMVGLYNIVVLAKNDSVKVGLLKRERGVVVLVMRLCLKFSEIEQSHAYDTFINRGRQMLKDFLCASVSSGQSNESSRRRGLTPGMREWLDVETCSQIIMSALIHQSFQHEQARLPYDTFRKCIRDFSELLEDMESA